MQPLQATERDTDMGKWFAGSLAIHLLLLALIFLIKGTGSRPAPPVIIDLTLSHSLPPGQIIEKFAPSVSASWQPVSRRNPEPAAAAPTVPRQNQARPEPQPASTVSQNTAPAATSIQTGKASTESAAGSASARNGTDTHTTSPPRATQGGGGSETAGQARQRYLKEHFVYIRDHIMGHLSYPPLARRRGWSGRVVLSFVVREDGAVNSIHVRESSGHPVLDNSAMQTVKNVAPFPRPPVAAEIVMPIMFRLE